VKLKMQFVPGGSAHWMCLEFNGQTVAIVPTEQAKMAQTALNEAVAYQEKLEEVSKEQRNIIADLSTRLADEQAARREDAVRANERVLKASSESNVADLTKSLQEMIVFEGKVYAALEVMRPILPVRGHQDRLVERIRNLKADNATLKAQKGLLEQAVLSTENVRGKVGDVAFDVYLAPGVTRDQISAAIGDAVKNFEARKAAPPSPGLRPGYVPVKEFLKGDAAAKIRRGLGLQTPEDRVTELEKALQVRMDQVADLKRKADDFEQRCKYLSQGHKDLQEQNALLRKGHGAGSVHYAANREFPWQATPSCYGLTFKTFRGLSVDALIGVLCGEIVSLTRRNGSGPLNPLASSLREQDLQKEIERLNRELLAEKAAYASARARATKAENAVPAERIRLGKLGVTMAQEINAACDKFTAGL
jgi:hypothetical protein